MFVGNLHFTGFANMLEFVLEEMLTEITTDTTIEIEFLKTNAIRMTAKKVATAGLINCIYNLDQPDMQQTNSLPVAIIVALSLHAEMEIHHLADVITLDSKQGEYILNAKTGEHTAGQVIIEFTPDPLIFHEFTPDYEQTAALMQKFAYLYPGVKIIVEDHRQDHRRNVFRYPQGISRLLDMAVAQHPHASPFFRLDLKAAIRDYVYQVSFCYQPLWLTTSYVRSFANHYELFLGGALIEGVQDGIILAIKEAALITKTKIRISKKKLVESMILIAAVRGKGLEFVGPGKWRLEAAAVKSDIKKYVFAEVARYLAINPDERNRVVLNFAYEFE
ncbi:hypothetical protein [Chitinophaga sp. sic0106]|uniref:hypothetical protein n=1 Tax=Chitinophaga sp. sic0106 TaxID=2854785 RepID=UPI001C48EFE4|nr:hypothetical protein [Chitinophaga sp. sic0106]MBV7534014.1 hypothetical protein [Chitinophaga sp. sic0106]